MIISLARVQRLACDPPYYTHQIRKSAQSQAANFRMWISCFKQVIRSEQAIERELNPNQTTIYVP